MNPSRGKAYDKPFLCLEEEEAVGRCKEQCRACADIERHEREDAPPDDDDLLGDGDDGEDTNVEDSYGR